MCGEGAADRAAAAGIGLVFALAVAYPVLLSLALRLPPHPGSSLLLAALRFLFLYYVLSPQGEHFSDGIVTVVVIVEGLLFPSDIVGVAVEIAGQRVDDARAEVRLEFQVQLGVGVGRLALSALALLPSGEEAGEVRQTVAFST